MIRNIFGERNSGAARISRGVAALLILTASVTPFVGRAQSSQPAHLQNALSLATQLRQKGEAGVFTDAAGVELNRHGGAWNPPDQSFIRFADDANGVLPGNYTECAPFVTRILQHAYGWNWSNYSWFDPEQNAWVTSASPNSYKYVGYIKSLVGFSQRITRLDEVQPGDIVAMRDVGDDTGHTGIVIQIRLNSAKPYLSGLANSDPKWAGTTYYEMEVVDSSASKHTNDSRQFYSGGALVRETKGAGTGVMGALVNANMEVVAHTWSLPTSGNYYGSTSQQNSWLTSLHSRLRDQTAPGGREMVFGRLALN
ncbi:MAG TPA: hypothetical protein VJ810_00835 [Blastocatellia bacterium]|nr:hypothetical protein [Blastocatellia bacterium]